MRGFATPTDREYSPLSSYSNNSTKPPTLENFSMSNQHEAMQTVWRQSSPVKYENVDTNPLLDGMQESLIQIECKSMLMQRLVWDGQPIGISCVDHTTHYHAWSDDEIAFMDQFCNSFLLHWQESATIGITRLYIKCLKSPATLSWPQLNSLHRASVISKLPVNSTSRYVLLIINFKMRASA